MLKIGDLVGLAVGRSKPKYLGIIIEQRIIPGHMPQYKVLLSANRSYWYQERHLHKVEEKNNDTRI